MPVSLNGFPAAFTRRGLLRLALAFRSTDHRLEFATSGSRSLHRDPHGASRHFARRRREESGGLERFSGRSGKPSAVSRRSSRASRQPTHRNPAPIPAVDHT